MIKCSSESRKILLILATIIGTSAAAIFFHISSGHTLGCTGVSHDNVVSILKWLDPSKKPVIVQTPVSQLGNY
jgi:hypothetical protein